MRKVKIVPIVKTISQLVDAINLVERDVFPYIFNSYYFDNNKLFYSLVTLSVNYFVYILSRVLIIFYNSDEDFI